MASSSTPKAPNTTSITSKSFGRGVAIVITIILVIILAFYLLLKKEDVDPEQQVRVALGTRTIKVTSEGMEPIALIDSRGRGHQITCRLHSDTTPLIVHWNGGEGSEGGFDVYVPPRNKRPANWKPNSEGENRSVSVAFQLPAGYKPVSLSYTISIKD